MNSLSTFKAINEKIKAALCDLDERIIEDPYFDCVELSKNNEAFIKILDQLLEMRCTIEELNKYPC